MNSVHSLLIEVGPSSKNPACGHFKYLSRICSRVVHVFYLFNNFFLIYRFLIWVQGACQAPPSRVRRTSQRPIGLSPSDKSRAYTHTNVFVYVFISGANHRREWCGRNPAEKEKLFASGREGGVVDYAFMLQVIRVRLLSFYGPVISSSSSSLPLSRGRFGHGSDLRGPVGRLVEIRFQSIEDHPVPVSIHSLPVSFLSDSDGSVL